MKKEKYNFSTKESVILVNEKTSLKHLKENSNKFGEFVLVYDHSLKKETLKETKDLKIDKETLEQVLKELNYKLDILEKENKYLKEHNNEQDKKIYELEKVLYEMLGGKIIHETF